MWMAGDTCIDGNANNRGCSRGVWGIGNYDSSDSQCNTVYYCTGAQGSESCTTTTYGNLIVKLYA